MDDLIDKELIAKDNKIGELYREIQGLTFEVEAFQRNISNLEEKTKKAELLADKYSVENKQWKPERAELNVRIGELEYELRTTKDNLQALSEEHDETLSLLARSEQRMKDYEDELATLTKRVRNYYRDKEILENKLAKLEELEEQIKSYGS